MSPTFTVLLPVVRPPTFLPYAIASVLAQERGDFELCIVCDGAPRETITFAQDAAARDPRIKVHAFAKGERNGEAHRHVVLQQSTASYVCQIADDDLWFPNHLSEAAALLRDVDFGHTLHAGIDREGNPYLNFVDVSDPHIRDRMVQENANWFGPTVACYRLDAYRRLPVGWSPAPPDVWPDLFMWRKFLTHPDVRVGTRFSVTSIHLPTSLRRDRPAQDRADEMARYAKLVASLDARSSLVQQLFEQAARVGVAMQLEADSTRARVSAAEQSLKALRSGLELEEEAGRALVPVASLSPFVRIEATRFDDLQGAISGAEADRVNTERTLHELRSRLAAEEQAGRAAAHFAATFSESVRSADARLDDLNAELAATKLALTQIERSSSWRITTPLRWLKRALAS